MQRSRMSPGDFAATYRGTWLLAKWEDVDKYIPIHVRDVEGLPGDNLRVYGQRADIREDASFRLYSPTTDISWCHPKMGMVNVDKLVAYHQRTSMRQWKRGLRGSLIDTALFGHHMARALRKPDRFNFDEGKHILSVFDPQYDSFEECVEKVSSGECYARAFSPSMCIEARPDYKLPLIINCNTIVGVVENGEPEFFEGSTYLLDQFHRVRGME